MILADHVAVIQALAEGNAEIRQRLEAAEQWLRTIIEDRERGYITDKDIPF